MKGSRFVGVALLALALMLVVIPASGASAAKLLVLGQEGKPIANGSIGDESLQLGDCTIANIGTVVENKASKIHLKETSTSEAECPEGESISGKIEEGELKSSGKSALKGTVTITKTVGPCVYSFSKWKSTFRVGTEAEPGFVLMKGEAAGKLSKELSSKVKGACEKTDTLKWFSTATSEPFGEPFQDWIAS